jgi:glycosyltransferase involved in cell wall biosynthesis
MNGIRKTMTPTLQTIPVSIAIRTSFKHHSVDSGYKQILKYTRPLFTIGIDEPNPKKGSPIFRKYKFLYEFYAKFLALTHKVDVIHILYAEEYFRFSARLFRKTPVVVTFHQPAAILEREINHGDPMGRMMKYAHQLNKRRFNNISAAIVLTEAQKSVLEKVMDASKIHVLPLGFNFKKLNVVKQQSSITRENIVLTVGDWQRDWDFYFEFVQYAAHAQKDWKFILINRKLSKEHKALCDSLPNLDYLSDVNDNELYNHYLGAKVQFLPFKSATGNNSLNEGLTLGCCVVSNFLDTKLKKSGFAFEERLDTAQIAAKIKEIFELSPTAYEEISARATSFASNYDWEEIAGQTINIYKTVI